MVTNAVEERLVVVRIRSFFERFEIVEGVFDLADSFLEVVPGGLLDRVTEFPRHGTDTVRVEPLFTVRFFDGLPRDILPGVNAGASRTADRRAVAC